MQLAAIESLQADLAAANRLVRAARLRADQAEVR
jgi:hypothetical protein